MIWLCYLFIKRVIKAWGKIPSQKIDLKRFDCAVFTWEGSCGQLRFM